MNKLYFEVLYILFNCFTMMNPVLVPLLTSIWKPNLCLVVNENDLLVWISTPRMVIQNRLEMRGHRSRCISFVITLQ